jgi:hypothetical protein
MYKYMIELKHQPQTVSIEAEVRVIDEYWTVFYNVDGNDKRFELLRIATDEILTIRTRY